MRHTFTPESIAQAETWLRHAKGYEQDAKSVRHAGFKRLYKEDARRARMTALEALRRGYKRED